MTAYDAFEQQLKLSLLTYLADAPTEVDSVALAHAVAVGRTRSRPVASKVGKPRSISWGLAAALIALALVGAASFAVGSGLIRLPAILPQPTTSAMPYSSPDLAITPSPFATSTPSATPGSTGANQTGHFVPTGSLLEARSRHAATALADGRVLIAGGQGTYEPHGLNPLDSIEVWDRESGAFSSSGRLNGSESSLTVEGMHAMLLLDGRALILPAGCICRPPSTEAAQLWDPATESIESPSALSISHFGYTATLLGDGRVLVAGGMPALGAASTGTAEVWDSATDSITPSGPMEFARVDAAATLLADGRVLIVGGVNDYGGGVGDVQFVSEVEIWDPKTQTFSVVPSLQGVGNLTVVDGRYNATALVTLNDRRVLFLADSGARIWDPATDEVAQAGSFLESRTQYTATLLADGRVLIVGGNSLGSDSRTLRSAEIWDPVTESFTSAGQLAEPRSNHTTTALPDGTALIVGGYAVGRDFPNSRPFGSAEIWEAGDVE